MRQSPNASMSVALRIDKLAADPTSGLPFPFNPRLEAHVDAAAVTLLDAFRTHDDVEAFELLVELCQDRMVQIARRVARRLGVVIDPEDLVATFLARLYTDVGRNQPRVGRFLALANTSMRNEALNQLRKLRRAHNRHVTYETRHRPSARQPDPSLLAERREHEQQLCRRGALILGVVGGCFHELKERDRRVLLAREVDGLTYDDLAIALDLPRGQIGMILKRARQHFASAIANAMQRRDPHSHVGMTNEQPETQRRATA